LNKLIIISLFISISMSNQTFYYNGSKKVYIKETNNISRSINQCRQYIENKKTICLNDEIIIKTKNTPILKLVKKYNLIYIKNLIGNMHLVSTKNDTISVANLLYENDEVDYAYPNFEKENRYRANIPTKDPLSGDAWHLKNTKQKRYYKSGADINIDEAWSIAKSKGVGILVGILDDGIDRKHKDMPANLGYSIHNPSASNPEHREDNIKKHGTKIATLLGGLENSTGSIGVAPGVKIVMVNIDRSSRTSEIVEAFNYMLKQKVDIISNSWGSYDTPAPIVDILGKVANSGRNGLGISIVFSVGNDNKDLDALVDGKETMDESELDSVIGVGGSTPYDSRYSRSNFGSKMDIVAPAQDLWVGIAGSGDKYALDEGTSFSAPIIAGVIALMLNVNENLTAKEIRTILINTADKIGTNMYDSNGFNKYYGYGRVNALDAVKEAKFKIKEDLSAGDFKLSIEKGWNLLSVPVKKTISKKNYFSHFRKGSIIITINNQEYDYDPKSIYPNQGFWLYSKDKYNTPFSGAEFNLTVDELRLVSGWNIVGNGIDINASKLIKDTKSVFAHTYNSKKGQWDFNPIMIKRGNGAFLYKD